MVIRELRDGSSIVSTQEDHAELSAQFAAHWGNKEFSRLEPYDTMVFATTYHDSGYREWEGNPPINLAKGRPYAHRETIPDFEATELQAYAKNVAWVASHDRYAGLLVSMHRTGLWENRYNAFSVPKGRVRERSAEVKAAKQALEQKQQEEKISLGRGRTDFAEELWFNFCALQIYDLLSLYFCCDGYASDEQFKEDLIAPVPVAYGSKEQAELSIVPVGPRTVRFAPYPFDISPLTVAVRARTLPGGNFASEEEGLAAYHKAVRQLLTFEIVN
jgi:Protein of unknown function (DUF3891)